MGYVVPFDRRVLMDIFVPPGQEGGASPGEMVIVELTRWPTADARRDRPRRRGARRHRRARRRHRDHHPQIRHSRRAFGRSDCRSRAARHRRLRARHPRPHRLPRRADGHDRRRARARFRRCDHDREAAERPFLARRAHRRRVALRAGGQRARSRGLRARHVGLLPRARRPHVPLGARDRALQPQPARRSAGAVVPDGSRSPRPGRPLRVPRRRDQQQRADDVHRGERHPDRSRSRAAEAVRAAGADVRADARAVPDPERRAAAARLDRLRSERGRSDHRRGRRGRGDHRAAAQRRAPADRRVHAARQRDGGVVPRGAGRAGALPHPRGAGHAQGREVRGVHLRLRLQPRPRRSTRCGRGTFRSCSSGSTASRKRSRSRF